MAKILVVSGHPNYKTSVANRAILDEFHRLVPAAEIVYLDALYPNAEFDVPTEQKRLKEADTIIFEFPMWWYSCPAFMHKYIEDVFAFGFAYGPGGDALKGKNMVLSFTTGAPEQAYSKNGSEGVSMDELLYPFYAMCAITGMNYLGKVVDYGNMPAKDEGEKAKIVHRGNEHAAKLVKLLEK